MSLEAEMLGMGAAARNAAATLRTATAGQRSGAIRAMAAALREDREGILAANAADLAAATKQHDRLMLDDVRLEAVATAIEAVAGLPDPVGEEIARWVRPNGLDIARVRTPIGVIGMIFEARPNVAADAAAICLRSGNAVILRPGSDCFATAAAIHAALVRGVMAEGLPGEAVQVVPTSDRAAVGLLLGGLDGTIDLIIPRGGRSLVERVQAEARVPVLGHLEGVCHTYVHAAADPIKAAAIVANAKLRRTGICGATETLLIDRDALPMLEQIAAALDGCELRGDAEARGTVPMGAAGEADWSTEYLAPILSIRTVSDWKQAANYIARFGTGHTEAIITEDAEIAEAFMAEVDSAIVMWNASTQFADGGEFGFGAEIGIATGKLHARGPVGPEQLTSFKYVLRGSGQLRP